MREEKKVKIYSVTDPEFCEYGRIADGYDTAEIVEGLEKFTPCPDGVEYVAKDPKIQELAASRKIATGLYGGRPAQFGWCNGHNTKLNCVEYHRASEFNLGTEDFILLLARRAEIVDGKLDSSKVKAFRVPKGVLVEVFATTLHYAPCHTDKNKGFRVLVVLPDGTNGPKPELPTASWEDGLLFAADKWLIAHPEASEVKDGAYVGITGENIDIADSI